MSPVNPFLTLLVHLGAELTTVHQGVTDHGSEVTKARGRREQSVDQLPGLDPSTLLSGVDTITLLQCGLSLPDQSVLTNPPTDVQGMLDLSRSMCASPSCRRLAIDAIHSKLQSSLATTNDVPASVRQALDQLTSQSHLTSKGLECACELLASESVSEHLGEIGARTTDDGHASVPRAVQAALATSAIELACRSSSCRSVMGTLTFERLHMNNGDDAMSCLCLSPTTTRALMCVDYDEHAQGDEASAICQPASSGGRFAPQARDELCAVDKCAPLVPAVAHETCPPPSPPSSPPPSSPLAAQEGLLGLRGFGSDGLRGRDILFGLVLVGILAGLCSLLYNNVRAKRRVTSVHVGGTGMAPPEDRGAAQVSSMMELNDAAAAAAAQHPAAANDAPQSSQALQAQGV